MRRLLRYAVMSLAAVLLVLGIVHGLRPMEGGHSTAAGSAAQGLLVVDEESAVYVLAVTDQSAAFAAGVRPGDYILRADGMDIADTAQLDALFDGKREAMELLLRRSTGEMLVLMQCR